MGVQDRIGKWGYCDSEDRIFEGYFDTEEMAIEAARNRCEESDAGPFEVGQYRAVHAPEGYIDANDIFEHICCQDEFSGDWADGFPGASKEQMRELTDKVQAEIRAWMERHDLLPDWVAVDEGTIREIAQ